MKKSGINPNGDCPSSRLSGTENNHQDNILKDIVIDNVGSDFEREPLIRPFGFAGGYTREIWQSALFLGSSSGHHSIGLGVQSVLWSDGNVFASHTEAGGNALMYAITERAIQMVKGQSYKSPIELLDRIFPALEDYARLITGNPRLRKTFILNALVALDNAAWLLYSKENGIDTFDCMVPPEYRSVLSYRHEKIAGIPLVSYNVSPHEIKTAVDQGFFFMKIKIGQPGTQKEMLEKDKARLTSIHEAIGKTGTRYTENGKLPYYLDANGRYEKKETLLRFLDHAGNIGAMEQIVIIEEPFAEDLRMDVSDIPVNLAADESAHTESDALERIQMGYGSIALKAIAKTLSMTLKIAAMAHKNKIPCFCADLTVNPVLVEWNKNVAARIGPFPGIGSIGLMESNGHQNYRNWETMMGYHPRGNAPWVRATEGIYELDDEFYNTGGGIFDPMPHYEEMFMRG